MAVIVHAVEEALRQAEEADDNDDFDWQEVQRQWDEYYAKHPEELGH
jgi:hypothetical protein